MADVDSALDAAGLTNDAVREYVRHWAGVTGAERVEVVSAADDQRLIQEALDAGELLPAGQGRYYSRSYYKDTARSEERTIVATNNPEDKGKRPLKKADRPVGEWNTFHIIVKGDKVTVYLNKVLVLKEQPLLNYWFPKEKVPAKGPIELQHHGDPLWFRNIYIKELPDSEGK